LLRAGRGLARSAGLAVVVTAQGGCLKGRSREVGFEPRMGYLSGRERREWWDRGLGRSSCVTT
jgi:hypothetical protein